MTGVWNKILKPDIINRSLGKIFRTPTRFLNLQEYQSKTLLHKNGVAVQAFIMLDNAVNQKPLDDFKVDEYVIKAQVLAGGRGKGHFDTGFKGGVHITKNRTEIFDIVKNMLGHRLITKQTSSDGIIVRQVMVAESVDIVRETYLCILMDREHNGPVIIASPAGGMDIETVAEQTPHLIKTVPIDINEGLSQKVADDIADFLKFEGNLKVKAAHEIMSLWEMFKKLDAIQLEINPLVETATGEVITVDAKISFDDNAQFRQQEVFAMDDQSETDAREIEALKYNLNYIRMDGNIGCLVNGAGLAMATMDIIKLNGGEPANFLDVGGSVQEEQVIGALKILISDPNVKAILVNVFGGIVNCVTIAEGIIKAAKKIKIEIPMVVRLEGTNALAARALIQGSGLPIISADSFDDAAQKVIKSIK